MKKKEQKELIITGAAVVVLIFLLISTFSKMAAKRPARPAAGALPSSTASIAGPGEQVLPPQKGVGESERQDREWGRDPFVLGKLATESEMGLILNGVIWDVTEPYAIINDEVVRENDRIGGYKVVDIKENRVVLDNGVEQISLNVWE